MNATIEKFGYPRTLLREYEHWVVLLRPKQVTIGSLVLAHKGEARALPEVPEAAFGELRRVTADLESALRSELDHEKINYLLLMMVDPHVHFHVLPRYGSPRSFLGREFADPSWPGPPDLSQTLAVDPATFEMLRRALSSAWPGGRGTSG